ncbi:hypothetical protein OB919_16015 [Halobacteria archaeon AArc-curdl1]|uniref:Uncharacterized protein n=1 Tax=Natronosalvus hydrolyticus TaxID=2979988 RepID=A0AAP2ZAB7_9EURY|nr:hypothetical protein [Halobacteria archaeon AArc-curdl1]
MAPEGWDVEGVHYGPKEGVRSSYSRRDIIREIFEITDIPPTQHAITHGCFTSNQLHQLLTYLTGEETDRTEGSSLSREVAEEVGIPHQKHQDSYHCFTEDSLWEILQAVKDTGENR